MASFLGEIKRRKVFQVAAVYAVVAWLTIQVVDIISEPLNLPDWLDTVVIILLAVGFPIAVILAWAFDLTPEGIKADADVRARNVTSGLGGATAQLHSPGARTAGCRISCPRSVSIRIARTVFAKHAKCSSIRH